MGYSLPRNFGDLRLGNGSFSSNKPSYLWHIQNLIFSLSIPKYMFSLDMVALWDGLGKCHYLLLKDEETKAKDLPKVTRWVSGSLGDPAPPFCSPLLPCLLVPTKVE